MTDNNNAPKLDLTGVYETVKTTTDEYSSVLLEVTHADFAPFLISVNVYGDGEFTEIIHVGEGDTIENARKLAVRARTTLKSEYEHVVYVDIVPAGQSAVKYYEKHGDKVKDEITNLLEGFDFVPSKGIPTILVGANNRLYLKGGVEKVLGVSPQDRVVIGYRDEDDAFALVLPSALRGNREAQAAGYLISNRKDVTCAKLFHAKQLNEKYDFSEEGLSDRTYYMDKTSSDSAVAIFRRY